MAYIYPIGGGGSTAFSAECTARAENVLAGTTAITYESEDLPITGTLPLTSVCVENGGLLAINSITAF